MVKVQQITAETEYSVIFSEQVKKIVQPYITMELLVFLLVKGVKAYQFNAKKFELNKNLLPLVNILKELTVNNIKKLEEMDMYMIFQLTLKVFMLIIF